MLDNETRLNLQTFFQISATPLSIINSELIKVEQSIERKWAILDEFSNCWDWSQWKNYKDGLYGEISYREYLLILQNELK